MNRIFKNARVLFAITGLALSGAATYVHADETVARDPGCEARHGDWKAKRLQRLDTDHDGVVSDAEKAAAKAHHEARREEMKQRLDVNQDGVVDDAERAQARAAMAQKMFERLDANRDGQISVDEVKCRPMLSKRFGEIDTDKSGTISEAELQAAAPLFRGMHRHHV